MKHIITFADFLNEGKSFEFTFNYNTDEDDVEYIQNILMDSGADAIAEPGTDSEEMVVKAKNAVELRKAKKAIQADGFEVNESKVNETVNVKDIKVGTILNFKDGETWKVTKTSGISAGKIFAAPYGDTKKNYVSLPIEFPIDKLEQDVKSLSESQVNEASAFMAKDVAKTVAFLNAEVGDHPGYIFFGDGEDIEDFDKLWKKRKYQEALDMLAKDREIEAQTFDDVKPWVKESKEVNEGFLDKGDGYWTLYIANKDTTIGKTQVPKGTVIGSVGGGNWQSTDGKINTHIAALLDTPDFDKVPNPTWPMTVEFTKEVENWARQTRDLIQRDPSKAQAVINNRVRVITDMRKLLK